MRFDFGCVSKRLLAISMAASLVGCVANSYRIPSNNLQQLAQVAPEQRGQSVRVIQEISESSAPPAERVDGGTDVIIAPRIHVSTGVHVSGGGGRSA